MSAPGRGGAPHRVGASVSMAAQGEPPGITYMEPVRRCDRTARTQMVTSRTRWMDPQGSLVLDRSTSLPQNLLPFSFRTPVCPQPRDKLQFYWNFPHKLRRRS